MLNSQLLPRKNCIVSCGNGSLRRIALMTLMIIFLPLVADQFGRSAVAGTPVKCAGPNGEVVYQDAPCLKALQKQAEDAQKTRQRAKQRQTERDKKWEALDAQRMKNPNPYGALTIPSEKLLSVAAECGAIVGRAASCVSDVDAYRAGSKCGDKIKFYANFDKVKEKEGFDQFALTAALATKLQSQKPISCIEVKRQVDDLLR